MQASLPFTLLAQGAFSFHSSHFLEWIRTHMDIARPRCTRLRVTYWGWVLSRLRLDLGVWIDRCIKAPSSTFFIFPGRLVDLQLQRLCFVSSSLLFLSIIYLEWTINSYTYLVSSSIHCLEWRKGTKASRLIRSTKHLTTTPDKVMDEGILERRLT